MKKTVPKALSKAPKIKKEGKKVSIKMKGMK